MLKVSSSKAGGSEEGRGGGDSSSELEEWDLWGIGEMSNNGGGLLLLVSDETSNITSVVDICPDVSLTEVWLLVLVMLAFWVTLGSSLMSETCVREVELIEELVDLRPVSLVKVLMVEIRSAVLLVLKSERYSW